MNQISERFFSSYIKENSTKKDFTSLVFFYKGYAEYCLEEYKNAYASFVRYHSEEKDKNKLNYSTYSWCISSRIGLLPIYRRSKEIHVFKFT